MAYNAKNYRKQGGSETVIGGALTIVGTGQIVDTNGSLAATGSTIADAAAIVTNIVFVTAADATKGVLLPAILPGERVTVKNTANAVLKVWPNTASVQINGLGAGNSISMAAYTCCDFVGASTVLAYTNPLVPS